MSASMKDNNKIVTDQPLTLAQTELLSDLLNVLIPASDDGLMPGAGELDLKGYLQLQSPDVIAVVRQVLNHFSADFQSMSAVEGHQRVVAFSKAEPGLFETLLFHTYACYYQDDRVMTGIGLAAGPPFPRGNSLDSGDLTSLDKVVSNSRGYRRV